MKFMQATTINNQQEINITIPNKLNVFPPLSFSRTSCKVKATMEMPKAMGG